jgi:DNA-binding NtrC family response regulator
MEPVEGRCVNGPPMGLAEARTTVLLVTGDADLLAVGARVLELAGYDVVTASHAGHALLACLTGARIDILITESMLDDMPGEALADALRRHHPALRSVFMADAGTPARDGFVVRPFTRDDLLVQLSAATLEPLPASQRTNPQPAR